MATRRLIVTTIRTVSGASREPAHDRPLDEHAERGRQHEQDRRPSATGARPPPLDVELPVGEGAEHPDRAMGEVEDARGGVGEHQAARRQGEDGRGAQPQDGEA